jgi:hypothetical protein
MLFRRSHALVVLAAMCLALPHAAALAGELTDENLGFSVTIPDDFAAEAQLAAAKPDFVHAFRKPEPQGLGTVIIIERMRGTIGRGRIDRSKMPSGFRGRILTAQWQGFDLDAIEVLEEADGVEMVNYNVQVPLKGEAVQLRVLGRRDRKDELFALTGTLLASLRGESNWLRSGVPAAVSESPHYGKVILAACAAGVIGGVTVLWLLRRRARRGTVLALAILIYAASWALAPGQTREGRAGIGTLRMIGFLGFLIGLGDAVRKREPGTPAAPGAPEPQRRPTPRNP